MSKLSNKIALITGGTTGIGAATARRFQAEGATVVVTGSNPRTIEAARGALPGVEVIASDQGDPSASAALMADVKTRHGRIDVLFVNAGIAQFAPVEKVDEAFFDRQFAINVRGLYFVVRHALPLIPDGGSIILTGSTAASRGQPGMSVYAATKAAVRSFARTLAGELAPRNVRVNVVSPGPIDTPIMGKTGMTPEQVAQVGKEMKAMVPLGRVGNADEVAAAAFFLATDATFVTGEELIVGGGLVNV